MTRYARTVQGRFLSAAILLGAFATAATGQQIEADRVTQARLQGIVAVDESLAPVPDAIIEVLDTEVRTLSGAWGQFELPDAPLGVVWVRVSAPGHPAIRQEVEIREDAVVFVQFLLPPVAAVLSEILVEAHAPSRASEETARTAWDLVAQRVPAISGGNTGQVGDSDIGIQLRGVSSLTQSMQPLLVVDEVPVTRTAVVDVLTQIPAQDVEQIEVLRGATASFRYPFASNGVIRIRTKH